MNRGSPSISACAWSAVSSPKDRPALAPSRRSSDCISRANSSRPGKKKSNLSRSRSRSAVSRALVLSPRATRSSASSRIARWTSTWIALLRYTAAIRCCRGPTPQTVVPPWKLVSTPEATRSCSDRRMVARSLRFAAPAIGQPRGPQVAGHRPYGGEDLVQGEGAVGGEHRDAHRGGRRDRGGDVDPVRHLQRDPLHHVRLRRSAAVQLREPSTQRERLTEVDVDAAQPVPQSAQVVEEPPDVLGPLALTPRLRGHQVDFVRRQLVVQDRDGDQHYLVAAGFSDRVGDVPQQAEPGRPQFARTATPALDRPDERRVGK